MQRREKVMGMLFLFLFLFFAECSYVQSKEKWERYPCIFLFYSPVLYTCEWRCTFTYTCVFVHVAARGHTWDALLSNLPSWFLRQHPKKAWSLQSWLFWLASVEPPVWPVLVRIISFQSSVWALEGRFSYLNGDYFINWGISSSPVKFSL